MVAEWDRRKPLTRRRFQSDHSVRHHRERDTEQRQRHFGTKAVVDRSDYIFKHEVRTASLIGCKKVYIVSERSAKLLARPFSRSRPASTGPDPLLR